MKYKDTYKAYTKLKENKQDIFYNEHMAEIILFERAFSRKQDLKYIQKSEVATLKKEKITYTIKY